MPNTKPPTLTDEDYARLLSEELNKGASSSSGVSIDAEIAKQLQEEEENQVKEFQKKKEEAAKLAAEKLKANPLPYTSYTGDKHVDGFDAPSDTPLTKQARKRIFQDIKALLLNADPTIHIHFDDDISKIEALIIGPSETPYEGGFFHFTLRFPHNYPWASPRVLLRTTDHGVCRFNPNLYANGKVCLSILGTWSGPAWSPIQSISSVLLSIQSLMNKYPYHNEPGYENQGFGAERENYNAVIRHETIRVAVIGMMDAPTWGDCPTLTEIRDKVFKNNIEVYERIVDSNLGLDGRSMSDPFGDHNRGKFQYHYLKTRLEELKQRYM